MSRTRLLTTSIVLAMLIATLIGSFQTRGVMSYLPFLQLKKGDWQGAYVAPGIVDQRPWKTAITLGALAQSAEERDLAREAERLADHEVDQTFSQSLRQASLDKPKLSPRAIELQQRITELEKIVAADQARLAPANAAPGTKPTPRSAGVPPALPAASTNSSSGGSDVAKAQLSLDQNELDDLNQELAHETGDQRIKLQQELQARQAAIKQYADTASKSTAENAVASAEQYKTLAQQLVTWRSLTNRKELVAQAEQLAKADVAALTDDQTRLKAEASADADKAAQRSASDRIDHLQEKAVKQNILSTLGDRLRTQQQLAALYERWGAQVEIQRRIVVHLILRSLAFIAAICLFTILAGWALQFTLGKMVHDPRQKQTLSTILRLATQVVGLGLVLLAIFGVPQQMSTMIGLVTAGLTVVFQDSIIAFCGWFVLMSRNGVRVGDWVEIDGVVGEVIQLGVFRTVVLETGNWTAHGHPTGRKVSFLNGYAIRGKYFNFSTVGQWMWDEIKVTIPAGGDAHPLIKRIYEAFVKATEQDAKTAESEWKRVTHEEGAPQFSAMPSVNLSPAGSGVDVVIRYITRAGVRVDTRNRLYSMLLDLMQSDPRQPGDVPVPVLPRA
ncbi:MAG TPA: mechanosensitive ion channel domain-containing protein [Candidatus Acidoferrum sp.]|nr:mechanosensitive ion channel domain-containing protein [Candidatus Acidoferrum sp.]